MRYKLICSILLLAFSLSSYGKEKPLQRVIKESMKVVEMQSIALAEKLKRKKDQLPTTVHGKSELITSDSHFWTSGFYPGVLWYLYEYKQDPKVAKLAELYTSRLEKEKLTTDNSNIGLILHCSFGNGYRLTNNPKYEEILVTGARSLSTRFRPICGSIQSGDVDNQKISRVYQIFSSIENMMNLELLMWATNQTGDQSFSAIAVSHANTATNCQFRPDNSSYQVVAFDSITGKPNKQGSFQGYSDESVWARGQAWGLYGFISMYEQTGLKRYLERAKKIATFILFHPNLPANKIPYWDFNAPNIPKEPLDVSAAAITASALIELSELVDEPLRSQYLNVAETQIRTLSSTEFLANIGTNGLLILKKRVGANVSEENMDVPISCADYYYVEALVRLNRILNRK